MSDCTCENGIAGAPCVFMPGARIYFACPRCAGGGNRRDAAMRALELTEQASKEWLDEAMPLEDIR